MSELPLTGVRILDLTSVVVGPAATLRLADLGAEIIKIEAPEGDLLRTLGGPSRSGQLSGKFLHFNHNKKFVCLNLRKQAGLDALGKILDGCDVFLTNIRPEALVRMKLEANSCRARKPALIHCTITGFGPDGPYRGKPAYDTVLQAASGLAGLSIERDGAPNFAPFLAADHLIGEIAAGIVSAALFGRSRNGQGTTVEIPMLETMAAFVLKEHLGSATFEPPLGPPGDRRVLDSNARPVKTADGWIAITANTDVQARSFLKAVGREDLADDPRFSSVAARVKHSSKWFALRARYVEEKSTAHWLELFGRLDIPAMPCNTLATLPDDPHVRAVKLIENVEHPTEGPMKAIRPTVLFGDETPQPGPLAREPGSDTRNVLKSAGLTDAAIDALVKDGAAIEIASNAG